MKRKTKNKEPKILKEKKTHDISKQNRNGEKMRKIINSQFQNREIEKKF